MDKQSAMKELQDEAFKNKLLMQEFRQLTGMTMPHDKIMLAAGKLTVDIFELDKQMNDHIVDYDWINCTYKGKEDYSMGSVIREHFGERPYQILKELLR